MKQNDGGPCRNKTAKDLNKMFEVQRLKRFSKVWHSIECSCPEKVKKNVAGARMLWEFIHDNMEDTHMSIRREFLEQYLHDANRYIRIVAYFEILPTSVIRKILSRENIDFESFESFLYEIKEDQFRVFRTAYIDLYEYEKVSRFFSEGRIKTLLDKKIDYKGRYDSRKAWKSARFKVPYDLFNKFCSAIVKGKRLGFEGVYCESSA